MNQSPEDISLISVTKAFRLNSFRRKLAVDDLTFGIPRGQVVGLLGPNGSGKSTTLKMILGFLRPSSGEILVCNENAGNRTARQYIGYLPENPRFQKFLTGRELLRYYGGLLGVPKAQMQSRIDHLLELVKLRAAADERVQGYSKGMTQRLAMAQALLNQPRILILDEPMSGLDPLGRIEMRKLIGTIHEELKESTIFFSSHVLEDVEQLCSLVVLLQKGKLKRFCPISELVQQEEQRFQISATNLSQAVQNKYAGRADAKQTAMGLTFSVEGSDALVAELSSLKSEGATVLQVSSQRRKLEEALFLENEKIASQPANL